MEQNLLTYVRVHVLVFSGVDAQKERCTLSVANAGYYIFVLRTTFFLKINKWRLDHGMCKFVATP